MVVPTYSLSIQKDDREDLELILPQQIEKHPLHRKLE
jgi:hypothetical protein